MTLMSPAPDDVAWMDDGLCKNVDPDLWTSHLNGVQRVAAKYCHLCPVEDICLAWALDRQEREGTWGGTTAAQRKRMLDYPGSCPTPV